MPQPTRVRDAIEDHFAVAPAARRPLAVVAGLVLAAVGTAGYATALRLTAPTLTPTVKTLAVVVVVLAVTAVWCGHRTWHLIAYPPDYRTAVDHRIAAGFLEHIENETARLQREDPQTIAALPIMYFALWTRQTRTAQGTARHAAARLGRLDLVVDTLDDGTTLTTGDILDYLETTNYAALAAGLAALVADVLHPADLDALFAAWDHYGLPRLPNSPTGVPTPTAAGGVR